MRVIKASAAVLLGCLLAPVIGLLVAPVLLTVKETPQRSDVLVLLGGEDGSRLLKAVELFKAGWAPCVIISGDSPARKEELIAAGVPERAILMENASATTLENAKFSVEMMRAHGYKSALLVTSWFHTRRARNCFLHFGTGLEFRAQPTWQTPEIEKDWGHQEPTILKEYPKHLLYLIRDGVKWW